MANVAHASLTGAELHEPKGAAAAALGTVYVADGAGSGSWSSVGTSSFTGMVADFAAPIAPSGWLELDGSVISTSTYSALFAVMSMTSSAARSNASAVLTSIPSTANMKVGYYVFGTGIPTGTTITVVDSATQLSISAPATSTGTSTIYVSPWLMDTGTVKLPDLSTAGRYRRSRSATTAVGQLQDGQNVAHTHGVSGNTGTESASHTHIVSGTTGSESNQHTHEFNQGVSQGYLTGNTGPGGPHTAYTTGITDYNNTTHTHNFTVTSASQSVGHSHSISVTSASQGGTEARPTSIVLMTCIKT